MKTTVLLADDDAAMSLALKKALEKMDCDVVVVENGLQAVEAFSLHMPDLVILDGVMPILDGYQACTQIKQSITGFDVPVLIITALSDRESAERALEVKADDFMAKPVNWAVFRFRVNRLLDISQKARHIHQLENFDSLTSLPNRDSSMRMIEQCIREQTPDAYALVLDVNRFGQINETYGNEFGDQLLLNISYRLLAVMGKDSHLGHLGQDVFFVCVTRASEQQMVRICRSLLDVFRESFTVGEHEIMLTASIGFVEMGADADKAEHVLAQAEVALMHAKEMRGGGYIRYMSYMGDALKQKTELEVWVRKALENHSLAIRYQTVVDVTNGGFLGVYCQPDLQGHFGVDDEAFFEEVMREAGLMKDLDYHTLRRTLSDYQSMVQNGVFAGHLLIEVSSHVLMDSDFLLNILEIIHDFKLQGRRVLLAVREIERNTDIAQLGGVINDLASHGIGCLLGNLGNACSVIQLALNHKVSGSVFDLEQWSITDESRFSKLEAVANLARGLGMTLYARGVTTGEEASMLETLGCDFAMGPYYGAPIDRQGLEEVLVAIGQSSFMLNYR